MCVGGRDDPHCVLSLLWGARLSLFSLGNLTCKVYNLAFLLSLSVCVYWAGWGVSPLSLVLLSLYMWAIYSSSNTSSHVSCPAGVAPCSDEPCRDAVQPPLEESSEHRLLREDPRR